MGLNNSNIRIKEYDEYIYYRLIKDRLLLIIIVGI